MKGEGVLGYLRKTWRKSSWKWIARFKLGNEMRGSKYWEGEESRIYRMCGRRSHGNMYGRNVGSGKRGEELVEGSGLGVGEEGVRKGWMRKLERERERDG